MTSSLKVGRLMVVQRSKPLLITIYGRLVSPHNIKTPKGRYFRLTERRDDDLGVYMYWMIRHVGNGKYEVLKRLDPRYCEPALELHKQSQDLLRNLSVEKAGE